MGISLGLVGLGSFGSAFADLFKSHPLVDRVALCDREPERIEAFSKKESFQDKFSPSDVYADLDEILTADLVAMTQLTTELVLEEAGITWAGINRVVPTGGSTRMPMVMRIRARWKK